MTFVSDPTRLRTWDPDRSIELKYDKRMSGGTTFMRLLKADQTFHFTMQTAYEPGANALEKPLIVRRVPYPQAPLAGFSIEETANIIRDALKAFKGIYGKHPDEQVRVDFVMPETDDEIIEKLTATAAQCRRLASTHPEASEYLLKIAERTEANLKEVEARKRAQG